MLASLVILQMATPAVGMRSVSCLPALLVPLLLDVLHHVSDETTVRDLDSVEFMSGRAEIIRHHAKLGAKCVGFDKSYSTWCGCDINSKTGFQRAMGFALRIKRHGSIWAAPVCSSWVWIARSGTGRCNKDAGGDRSQSRVRSGNVVVVRLVLIFLVCWTRGVHLFLENPLSTITHQFSPLKELIESMMPFKQTVHLSAYGSDVAKPLFIWSSCSEVMSLYKKTPKVTKTFAIRGEDGKVAGKRSELKSSQAYPAPFGDAVARIFVAIKLRASLHDLLDVDFFNGLRLMSDEENTKSKRVSKSEASKSKTNGKSKSKSETKHTKKRKVEADTDTLALFLTLAGSQAKLTRR